MQSVSDNDFDTRLAPIEGQFLVVQIFDVVPGAAGPDTAQIIIIDVAAPPEMRSWGRPGFAVNMAITPIFLILCI
ncbi:hypothetical protein D6850_00005 [Roseovarius spongiae]|uniref:Uncharacterized protein n=1 Tax=Roseovarius spongiae TaxID=2320272 RepID=A0A3A8AWA2_9RHOB|nr:hypothetical protein D6850_00005 [Roseovarius spongiae]